VPAGREGVAHSPSHQRLPAKHPKLAKLCQRNAYLRRRFVCLPACWDVCECVFVPPPQRPDPPGPTACLPRPDRPDEHPGQGTF
jgi:hypothetical protein